MLFALEIRGWPWLPRLAIHELLLTTLLLASPWHLQYYCDLSSDVAMVVSERLSGHLHPPWGEELVSGLSGDPGRKPSPAACVRRVRNPDQSRDAWPQGDQGREDRSLPDQDRGPLGAALTPESSLSTQAQ